MTRTLHEHTHAAIEALRRGRAPGPAPRDSEGGRVVRLAALLALAAGRAPRPGSAFVARLERDLLAQQLAPARGAARGVDHPRRRVLRGQTPIATMMRAAALALPVVLAVALLVVRGPQQVLADVRRLLSYVPGLGFVATQNVRVLAEPVEVTHDGVTVRVDQVIADDRETRIVLSVHTTEPVWGDDGLTSIPDAGIVLRPAVGGPLPLVAWSQRPGGALLAFGPLAVDSGSAVLSMRVPPGLNADTDVPQAWTFDLTLRREDHASPEARLTEPYDPGLPAQSHQGITLALEEVAHTTDETVVRVAIELQDPEARMPSLTGRYRPTLVDDTGRNYVERRAPGVGSEAGAVAVQTAADALAGQPPALEQVLAFEPLRADAAELTLVIDGVEADLPAAGAFQVDLGAAPRVGDVFPLDVQLEVAGATVRLTRASLVREELEVRDGMLVRTLLQFDAEQTSSRDNVIVPSLTLSGDRDVVSGSSCHGGPQGVYAVGVELADGRIPRGILSLTLERAGVTAIGPWIFSWDVPPVAHP